MKKCKECKVENGHSLDCSVYMDSFRSLGYIKVERPMTVEELLVAYKIDMISFEMASKCLVRK